MSDRKKIEKATNKPTQKGKPRWAVQIDGEWYATYNALIGVPVDELVNMMQVDSDSLYTADVEIEIKDGWKNLNAIKDIEKGGVDPKPAPKQSYGRTHESSGEKNRSFALSYSKDIAIARSQLLRDTDADAALFALEDVAVEKTYAFYLGLLDNGPRKVDPDA